MPARPMTIRYNITNVLGDEYYTIDLSEGVSLVSRKFYRQGLEWAVAGIRVASTQSIKLDVATLPQTYVCAEAWRSAYLTWRRMQKEARAAGDPDAVRARFSDFKVAFDGEQIDAADDQYAPNLVPYPISTFGGNADRNWRFSEFNFPDDSDMFPGKSMLVHMIGNDLLNVSIGAIHNWASGRVRPTMDDPNVPQYGMNNAFDHVFDYGGESSATLEDLTSKNDLPPYWNGEDQVNEEYYPGGKNYRNHWEHHLITKTNVYNSGVGVDSNGFVPGFTAYCGLIRIHLFAGSTANVDLFVDLLPGPHDGYMARPMQEVN